MKQPPFSLGIDYGLGGFPAPILDSDPLSGLPSPTPNSFVGGQPQVRQAAPQQPLPQSGNAVQRWQSGRTARYRVDLGLIDAHAPQSPLDTTPSGAAATAGIGGDFTPQAQWDNQFQRQINIPKASAPAGGFSWDSWYARAGGNPASPSVPPNPIPETTKPDYTQ